MSEIITKLPEEVEPYADDLRRFIDAMVYKLRVHSAKGKWENVPMIKAVDLLNEEIKELHDAINSGNTIEVLLEAADVGNFALIISSIMVERGK